MDATSHLGRYVEKEVEKVLPDERVSGAELGQGHSRPEAAHDVLYSSSLQLLELLLHLALPDLSHCLALVINLDVGRTVVDDLGSSRTNQCSRSSSCFGPLASPTALMVVAIRSRSLTPATRSPLASRH